VAFLWHNWHFAQLNRKGNNFKHFNLMNMATKVTLREKKIKKGMKSLYLDFYPAINNPDTGKPTRREF